MERLDQEWYKMVVNAGWYIKPVTDNYFLSSVSHKGYIWQDYHEKKMKGYLLGTAPIPK